MPAPGVIVRPARRDDIAAMSAVLTASITELCAADHANRRETLAAWLANKSPEGVRAMLDAGVSTLLVAERDGAICAVGAIAGDAVVLNYVDPAVRFTGVSKAMLAALEAVLRASGVGEARLTATTTACRFYLDAGWQPSGAPQPGIATMVGYPMTKRLSPSPAASGAA